MSVKQFAGKLIVPTYDNYHHDADPTDQPEFANPVTLNNYQVIYANAVIELAERNTVLASKRQAHRQRLRELASEVRAIETEVFRQCPPPDKATKNLKMQHAYVRNKAAELGLGEALTALDAEEDQLRNAIDEIESSLDQLHRWWDAIKLASENGKTHLAFVKDEMRRSGYVR